MSLLLVGAGPRLAVAGVIVALLWAAFFAVTGLPVPFLGDS
ncbi:hypothetical protein [Pacificoceanicola onchidii]|nr:hypothetical protein [Pacificoceanicola onchidii]